MVYSKWQPVAERVVARMAEIPIEQAELARKAGVSDPVVRSLMTGRQRAENPRPGPIRKVSAALGWTPDSIERILAGDEPVTLPAPATYRLLEDQIENLELVVADIVAALQTMPQLARALSSRARSAGPSSDPSSL